MMDDLLVLARIKKSTVCRWLKMVLRKLCESKIILNREKCEFAQPEVKFLGQIIDQNGVHPDPLKVKAITDMLPPTNQTEARCFLGMTNQLNKFCQQLLNRTKPIRDLLTTKNEWLWGEQQQKSFDLFKQHLSTSLILALFEPGRETIVSSDASSYGLGAVLKQKQSSGETRPIAYILHSLTETE